MVRAKFKCTGNTVTDAGTPQATANIRLEPVIMGSEENDTFYRYTPAGQIYLNVVNPAAAEAFEVGKEYYIDFTPAE
jgi:hypothetical protein